jgi:cytochrome P450
VTTKDAAYRMTNCATNCSPCSWRDTRRPRRRWPGAWNGSSVTPDALHRLQAALRTDDGDAHLESVIHETLRIRPVIDQVVRRLTRPIELAGYTIPAGTIVAPSILGVQRSDVFAPAEEFQAERFLHQRPPPHALIPFGGGTRRCIGAAFAVMEMKVVLRAVLESVGLQAPTFRPERRARWNSLTATPAKGARVIVAARPKAGST